MSVFESIKRGLGLTDEDEGSTDWDAEPSDIDLVEADEITTPDVGDSDSKIAPPPNLPPDVPGDLP